MSCSWLYRTRPAVCHRPFTPYTKNARLTTANLRFTPNQLRWSPFDVPAAEQDFVDGLATVAASGDPAIRSGINIHMYTCNVNMKQRAFYNADGDLLIVPQMGTLEVRTELGTLLVTPNEICVVPRGIVFQVNLPDKPVAARGYILEVFDGHFELPDLGPIGANGLANPQDFAYPVAAFERTEGTATWHIINKFTNQLFVAERDGSPFNVVAWRGNYAPFKYNLARFNAVNSVTWDHPDPSIFTVLTCKSAHPGTAIADFVVFPPRWVVSEHTFRPPYFHRNAMSEFMGLIHGTYEAKQDGFLPGGGSLHSMMTPHGPDAATFHAASVAPLHPVRVADNTLAFMFESSLMLGVTPWALEESGKVQSDYYKAWEGLQESQL